ncbi:hypothetical protein LEP1GSC060_2466 [Leptospira weilii serovar Ranarum str. ICFT]|uniref:Uncharacterized protein n=1 Tax=Leptospira weilii serovar Ranarum str. ICFT TaxID=1218598 RepID=N1WQ63_9LEPT|nr:hypothetical protein LEP1GSC060_2466 [Leptospira weilii serovar Ranarum str. ICFT]
MKIIPKYRKRRFRIKDSISDFIVFPTDSQFLKSELIVKLEVRELPAKLPIFT